MLFQKTNVFWNTFVRSQLLKMFRKIWRFEREKMSRSNREAHPKQRKLKTELDLNYYLPTQFVIRQLKYRRKRVEVPVIKNLIFIQATKQDACDISNKYNIQLFYMKDLLTRAMLIVPDKQMQDFIFVMDLDPNGVSFDNDHLSVGSRVQVVKGDFCGVEGELASEANKTYVVIRIAGVLSASVKVPKSYLRVI